jgi:hypothetical protein
VYRKDTWKLAEATVIPMEQDLPVSFRYIDDNSYKYQPSTNPGYKAFITSPMNIMADMTAAMAEQSIHSGGVHSISGLKIISNRNFHYFTRRGTVRPNFIGLSGRRYRNVLK